MFRMTTQHDATAAVAVARAGYVGGVSNGLMAEGSWSIRCTTPATFHKPRPRRSQVTSS
jgi:hypothetical protein